MLKPIIKFYDFTLEACGFDLDNMNPQVCEVEGKQRKEDLRILEQLQQQKDMQAIVYNGSDVELILNAVNHGTKRISERDYEVKKGDKTTKYHSHTTIFKGPEVVVNVNDELVLRASKRYTRLKKTNLETNEFTITGETHYRLYVNGVLHKIDTTTVPDSTIPDNEKAYTVNFHGEQEFRRMLEKQLKF